MFWNFTTVPSLKVIVVTAADGALGGDVIRGAAIEGQQICTGAAVDRVAAENCPSPVPVSQQGVRAPPPYRLSSPAIAGELIGSRTGDCKQVRSLPTPPPRGSAPLPART